MVNFVYSDHIENVKTHIPFFSTFLKSRLSFRILQFCQMKKCIRNCIFILLLALFSSSLFANVIYVNTNAPGGGDGSSWASAYRDLQPALQDAAISGFEIWVAQGSYFIIGTSDVAFTIPSGVKVFGGFTGAETTRTSRDWLNNETILDGANTFHTIVYFLNTDNTTELNGFTLQRGNADGASSIGRSGAAIFINVTSGQSADPIIRNCTIKDCHADSNGGAVYIDGSGSTESATPTFENCTFDTNDSFSDGGAVYASGISNGTCTPIFENCTFMNNLSVGSGGAIFFHGGGGNASGDIKKCNFDQNTAESNGGAIYSLGTGTGEANHTIINSRFYANKGFAAGGIYNNGGNGGECSPEITNCTFYLNEATGNGGTGGAIYNNGSDGGDSSPLISNCILYGNIGPFDSQVFRNVEGSPSIQYSLVDVANCTALDNGAGSNVSCGIGMIYNMNPMFENVNMGDLHLQNISPAIDQGNDNDNPETEDLDCNPRKTNTIDLGAYEAADQNLPVELAEFQAYLDDEKIALLWITLSEEENAFFTVERSADGRDFEALSTHNSAGTTSRTHSYKAYDKHPLNGYNYYRIKNTSFSGAVEYSPVRVVEMTNQKLHIYPNPVENQLTVTLSNVKDDEARFAIYDIYGKTVSEGTTAINNDISFIQLREIGSFLPGTYILNVYTSRNGSFSKRFQKIRD